MKKKYTIEEFKKMFDKAVGLALKETTKDFKEAVEKNNETVKPLEELAFTMQNGLAYAALRIQLFGGKSNE